MTTTRIDFDAVTHNIDKAALIDVARQLGLRRDWARTAKNEMVAMLRGFSADNVHRALIAAGVPNADLYLVVAADEAPAVVDVVEPVVEPVAAAAPAAAPAAQPVAQPAPVDVGHVAGLLTQLLASNRAGVNADDVRDIVEPMLAQHASHVAEQIAKAIDDAPARSVEIKAFDNPATRIDGVVHPVFEKVVRLAAAGLNVALVGPAGCGKTHLFEQVAQALGHTSASISGSAGVTEAQLTGRLLPTGDGGRFQYVESPFVRQYTADNGAFLFDEMDAFDPNCLLVVNQATANGGFHIDARAASGLDTFVKRGNKTLLFASLNTFGNGADMMYVGRSQLDAATLDRWYIVRMDYNAELEASLSGLRAPKQARWTPADEPTEGDIAIIGQWVLDLRKKASDAKLRRIVSTRALQKAITARRAGVPFDEIKTDITAGWTKDELAKVGL